MSPRSPNLLAAIPSLPGPSVPQSMSPAPAYPPPDPNPAPNFDHLARAYRWMEYASFGPFLERWRAAFLSRLTPCHNALILGDGDGRFTARLLRENPSIRVHTVDASAAMLAALTQACCPNATRLTTEQADLRSWQPHPPHHARLYDLVVTHFFLDCLSTSEVQTLAQQIRTAVSPGAMWVVSEFAIPPGWFGRLIAAPIIHALYLAFGLLTSLRPRTLPHYASALTSAGFTQLDRHLRLSGLLVSELWTTAALPGP